MSKLLKSDLSAFTAWLSHKGIKYVEGKGEFKVLSVTTSTGSHHLFEKPGVSEHYVITKYLAPLLRDFLQYKDDTKQETPKEVQPEQTEPEQASLKAAA